MKCFPVQELVAQHLLTSKFGLACSTTPCPENSYQSESCTRTSDRVCTGKCDSAIDIIVNLKIDFTSFTTLTSLRLERTSNSSFIGFQLTACSPKCEKTTYQAYGCGLTFDRKCVGE